MKHELTRRTVLRGFGTALALPLLESIAPARGRWSAQEPPPARLVYVYVPNGMHMPDWSPAVQGADYELPWILEPLAPLRARFSILGGLAHDKARANGDGPGDHARAAAVFLTGVQPLKTDGQVRLGASADQIAAAAIGDRTRFRSVQLGMERGRTSGQCDSGYSCAYSSNISWQSDTTPAAKEVNPRTVFDRLFRGGGDELASAAGAERRERRKSVLDFVRADAERLRARLAAEDRRKLDEYESGLRELLSEERRGRRIDFEYKSEHRRFHVRDASLQSRVTVDVWQVRFVALDFGNSFEKDVGDQAATSIELSSRTSFGDSLNFSGKACCVNAL